MTLEIPPVSEAYSMIVVVVGVFGPTP